MSEAKLSQTNLAVINSKIEELYPVQEELPLLPGELLEFSNFTELLKLEDTLPLYIDNDPESVENWAGRPVLKELVRVDKKTGQFGTLFLERLSTDNLADIIGNKNSLFSVNYTAFQARTLAFALSAEIRSTGRGIIGISRFNLVYTPVPFKVSASNARTTVEGDPLVLGIKKDRINHVIGIRRMIGKVSVQDPLSALEELRAKSEANADLITQYYIKHPFSGGSMSGN